VDFFFKRITEEYMRKYIVNGPNTAEGEIQVQGAKNSVLPILAATILAEGECVLHSCPNIRDVSATVEILKYLNCKAEWVERNVLLIDTGGMKGDSIPDELMREMRSSVILAGAILSRCRTVKLCYPGGCELGPRPIDLHLRAFEQLGVRFSEEDGYICGLCDKIAPCDIHLTFPSVGATENIMLFAAKTQGVTVIHNAAKEPEIADLQGFLNCMGARVQGAGGSTIVIEGVKKLSAPEYEIMPDRIAAITYLATAAITGGKVLAKHVRHQDISASLALFEECGCTVTNYGNSVYMRREGALRALRMVRTMPHPGFPTDALAPFMSCMAVAQGTSMFVETIFQNRYKHAAELERMGADIKIDGRVAIVSGVPKLHGASLLTTDLRGGAALALAAAAAEGRSEIGNVELIERGYESFCDNLAGLGIKIREEIPIEEKKQEKKTIQT
jgi:UDP-N-acetylglucosamine 1-carboxyvinyltransferase